MKVQIVYKVDQDCDMEQLTVNGKGVGGGNTHDNHCRDRFEAIKRTLTLLGIEFEAITDFNWRYE